jgi:hypothetical protein
VPVDSADDYIGCGVPTQIRIQEGQPRPLDGAAGIGLNEGIVTTKTLGRRLFGLAGRLTRSGPSGQAPPAGALAMGDRLEYGSGQAPGDPAHHLTTGSRPTRRSGSGGSLPAP